MRKSSQGSVLPRVCEKPVVILSVDAFKVQLNGDAIGGSCLRFTPTDCPEIASIEREFANVDEGQDGWLH
jgi:hypothetical protein